MLDSDDTLLPAGKLPGELLDRLLRTYATHDPSVIIGPGVGRDAAAIRIGDRVIVVKTDPITFATSDAGRYLVNVNANDIVCMGAVPRWLLVTALLPEKLTTPSLVEEIFASLAAAAAELEIVLVGGHTEISIGLDRPILVGQMIGEADEFELYDMRSAQTGDCILLCSGIAVEGTAILAREAAALLAEVDEAILDRAAQFLVDPGISILPAARALKHSETPIRGLHDPTEGGIITALAEVASASGHGVEVDLEAIPIRLETSAICRALNLDPLGLIASGSLLAVVPESAVQQAVEALEHAGIHGCQIGKLLGPSEGSVALSSGSSGPLPVFKVDEIARFFAEVR
jgi:hydrogenase expression/formation protein HypE